MNLEKKIAELSAVSGQPCVTLSFNTHRTHPEHLQDEIVLKNLVKEAIQRLEDEYGKREVMDITEKLEGLQEKMDIQYNLDSMHIFVSKDKEEMIKSTWPTRENVAKVDESFAIRPLIFAMNRSERYLILELEQGKTSLYIAENDAIIEEVKNHVFPFGENPNDTPHNIRRSDAEYMDALVKEHYNDIDKALVDYMQEHEMIHNTRVIVISTEDNFSKLQAVANRPAIYAGHSPINYVDRDHHHLAGAAWEIIKDLQHEDRKKNIDELKAAVSQAQVLTDLNEIYQAAIDGRGDLLIIHQDFSQPVKMIDDRSFEIVEDSKEPGVIDDITSTIAWEVKSKGGRVIITHQDDIKELGNIALKTRY